MRSELSLHKDLEAQLHEMQRLFQEEGKRRALLQNKRALTDELTRLRERVAKVKVPSDALQEAGLARQQIIVQLEEISTRLEAARTEWVRDQQEALTKREEL